MHDLAKLDDEIKDPNEIDVLVDSDEESFSFRMEDTASFTQPSSEAAAEEPSSLEPAILPTYTQSEPTQAKQGWSFTSWAWKNLPYIGYAGAVGAASMEAADILMGLERKQASTLAKCVFSSLSFITWGSIFTKEIHKNVDNFKILQRNDVPDEWVELPRKKLRTVWSVTLSLTVLSYLADIAETMFFVGDLPKNSDHLIDLPSAGMTALIMTIAGLVIINTTFTESLDMRKVLGDILGKKKSKYSSNFSKYFSPTVGTFLGGFNTAQDLFKSLAAIIHAYHIDTTVKLGIAGGLCALKTVGRFSFTGILAIENIDELLHYLETCIKEKKVEFVKLGVAAGSTYLAYLLAINDRNLEEDFPKEIMDEISRIIGHNLNSNPELTKEIYYYLSWVLFSQYMLNTSVGIYDFTATVGGTFCSYVDKSCNHVFSNTYETVKSNCTNLWSSASSYVFGTTSAKTEAAKQQLEEEKEPLIDKADYQNNKATFFSDRSNFNHFPKTSASAPAPKRSLFC